MRISLSLTASILAIFLASCGGDDEDPNPGATSGGGSGSVSSTTSGTGGGASSSTSSASSTTSGTGGGASSSSTSASASASSTTSGTGGDTSSSSTSASTSSSGGSTGEGGSGGDGGMIVDSGLPVPPGDANVPKPSGAPGGLKVIDWAGFTGAVSYSFDDTNSSQISNYDKMNAFGVRYTFYLQTNKTNEINNQVWQRALEDGHEIGNHTRDHSSSGDLGGSTDAAQQFLKQKFGVDAYTMAAPNGASGYTNVARTRFLINRGVSNSVIAPYGNSDPFTLPTFIPNAGAPASALDAEVTSARQAKGWRTFCIHGFTGGNDGAYNAFPLQSFLDNVEHTKALGDMWIDSMVNVGAYWLGQKAIGRNPTNTQSGTDTIYTWQLPDHFPPGKFVRVTVTGGTLKQNGVPLRWDPHGYYEVALDPESVTLSP